VLPSLWGFDSWALDVNSFGQVVGVSNMAAGSRPRPTFWDSDGTVHDLGTFGAPFGGVAMAINTSGVVALWSVDAQWRVVSARWDPIHGLQALPERPGFGGVGPNAINKRSEIVGTSALLSQDYVTHGMWWSDDGRQVVDLNDVTAGGPAGWLISEATGINDRGVLCGRYLDAHGVNHGFVARPVGGRGDGPAGTVIAVTCALGR
jgi:probable HAF family extracellular repeat protein